MTPTLYLLLAIGALGHAIFWVAAVNRLHALAINRKLIDFLTLLCGLGVSCLPLVVLWGVFVDEGTWRTLAWSYVAASAVVGVVGSAHRFYTLLHRERSGALVANHTTHYKAADLQDASLTAPGIPALLARLPGNQVLAITVHEKQLVIPRLAPEQDGLRIVHLSDLHMSGRIAKPYFQAVVEKVNETQPDVVAITGDIVERTPCIDWIPDTLGRLRAPGGVYYVLGNHDKNVAVPRLHRALADAGLIHAGGMCHSVTLRAASLTIAGNELPWFGRPPDFRTCPVRDASGQPLRVVLAHSPDQLAWARENEVDLLLAGHNHGGQVRLPLLGAILCPSLHGVRYAAGAFRCGNTVLHVSRGTASFTPVRWNCPPEIAVLILRAAGSAA